MTDALWKWDATALAQAIRTRQISAREAVTEDALDAALEYICSHAGVWRATGSEIAAHYLAQLKT